VQTPAGILAAGGTGERMAASLPKQFVTIGGRPVLARSFEVLRAGGCSPIVVVAPAEHMEHTRSLLSPSADVAYVTGGATRQDSVRAGLASIESETVVVHDAARPFASPELVRLVVRALRDADAAVVALPLDETVKRVESGRVVETVDREGLWRSQTPQAFRTSVLKQAHDRALREGRVATDDAQLVELMGGTVAVVEGSSDNIKITQPSDLELGEVLAGRSPG